MKHWTELLPEAGTIAGSGRLQLAKAEDIARLEEQVERKKQEWYAEEKRLQELALTQWTQEEIDQAQAEELQHDLYLAT